MSSTATTAPRPPGAFSPLASDHASGMLIPLGPQKFHCSGKPGSLGWKALAWAKWFGTAYFTRGSRRSSETVLATDSPSSIASRLESSGRASSAAVPVSDSTSACTS